MGDPIDYAIDYDPIDYIDSWVSNKREREQ